MTGNVEPLITASRVWQGSDCVLLARIRSIDGTYIQQSAITSIALTVYDRNESMAIVVGPIALTVSAVIFNTLQPYNVPLWTVDHTGYNFRYRLAGAAGLPRATDYRVTIVVTLTDGTSFPIQYSLSAVAVP